MRLKLLIVRVPHGVVEKSCDDETAPKAFPPPSSLPQLPPATGPPAMALAVLGLCAPHATWSVFVCQARTMRVVCVVVGVGGRLVSCFIHVKTGGREGGSRDGHLGQNLTQGLGLGGRS